MTHKIVDLRGRVRGCKPTSNIGTKAKSGGKIIAAHYNGPATEIGRSGGGVDAVIRQIEIDADYQMVRGRYSPGFAVDGVMYTEAWHEDTVYLLRNEDAVVWHAADQDYNYNAVAATFLIGEGQTLSPRTLQTATERTEYHLKKQGATSRANVKGHLEVSDLGTACPGPWIMANFVRPFREGRLNARPTVPSTPWDLAKYNFLYSTGWGKERTEFLVAELNKAAGKVVAVGTSDPAKIIYASEKAYNSEPAGKLAAICMGTKTVPKLHWSAQGVIGKYGRDESDIWDARNSGELRDCLMEILGDENLADEGGLLDKFTKRFGGTPVGRPTSPLASKIDGYFGTQYGQEIVEEADRAGLHIAAACALVEQESGGKNIFGADWGTQGVDRVPFAHLPVTDARVNALIAHVRGGGVSNGVGLTQLTWRDFVYEVEAMGGAHIPRYQLRVGFELLASYFDSYGEPDAWGAYNAGPGNRASVRGSYSASCMTRRDAWLARLR